MVLAGLSAGQQVPGIFLEHGPDGDLLVRYPLEPGIRGVAGILGKALPDGTGGWRLGCWICSAPIDETCLGLCGLCRQRVTEREKRDQSVWDDIRADRA